MKTTVTVLKTPPSAFEEHLVALLKSRRASKVISLSVAHVEDLEATLDPDHGTYTPALSRFEVSLSWETAIPGHTLVAHLDLANGMVTSFGGELGAEEYKRMDGRCELCGSERDRRHQFLVENDATKERRVVGGSCARKFCGVDLENVVASLSYATGLVEGVCGEEDLWGCGSGSGHALPFDVRLVLAVAEETVKSFGWTSRDMSNAFTPATADLVRERCYALLSKKGEKNPEAGAVLVAAAKALDLDKYKAFAKAELARRWSDLAQSWANALDAGAIDDRGFGRLSYLVVAYGKALARSRVGTEEKKAYHPAVGLNKMHDLPGEWTVVALKEGETEWGYYVGVTAKASDGTTVWFKSTTKTKGVEIGGTYRLRGKVTGTKDTISFMSHASVR